MLFVAITVGNLEMIDCVEEYCPISREDFNITALTADIKQVGLPDTF
jgi:hypothetical protein